MSCHVMIDFGRWWSCMAVLMHGNITPDSDVVWSSDLKFCFCGRLFCIMGMWRTFFFRSSAMMPVGGGRWAVMLVLRVCECGVSDQLRFEQDSHSARLEIGTG